MRPNTSRERMREATALEDGETCDRRKRARRGEALTIATHLQFLPAAFLGKVTITWEIKHPFSRRRTDDICMMSSPKKQKIDEGEKMGANEDRISELPDCLLHDILSLLPTKNAVATCILSRRWQDLWTSVPNLDLNCTGYCRKGEKWKKKSFTHFEEKVLLRSSNIQTFRLSLDNSLDVLHVNFWIFAAVRRQVQEICLTLPSQTKFMLPRRLCTCKTLRALKVNVPCVLELPRTISLPNLTALHLGHVRFADDVSIHKLFSCLPVLEELKLTGCGWEKKSATISIPTLKSLFLDSCSGHDFLDGRVIKFHAENLIYFSCVGHLTVDLLLYSLSLLVDASIDLDGFGMYPNAKLYAAKLFKGIRFVKSLKIGSKTLECLHHIFKRKTDIFPTFGNLTSLKVNAVVSSKATSVLKYMFHNSPILESLVVRKVSGGKWMKDSSSQCLMLCLKTCSLEFF